MSDPTQDRAAQPAGAPEVFFKTFAMPVVFVVIALGFHFFLRGHNAPGGGFIAGLLVAVAALLARMARDLRLLRIRVETLVPVGLLIALATGVAPMLGDKPFLTSDYGYVTWPWVGEFEWATAVAFDLGVFLVVVGTTITIIDLLADDRNLLELGPTGLGEEDVPVAPMAGAPDDDADAESDDVADDATAAESDHAADSARDASTTDADPDAASRPGARPPNGDTRMGG